MDVLDENEALQQFFEGKSPLGAMVSSRRRDTALLTFTLCAVKSTYALPLEECYQITPELRSTGLPASLIAKVSDTGNGF